MKFILVEGIQAIRDKAGSIIEGITDPKGVRRLRVESFPSTNFLLEVARGNIDNHEDYNIVGFASEIDTVGGTIWPENTFYTFPITAQTLEIFSSLANDSSGGTGGQILRIFGLDSNYNEIQEDVTLNGTTVVTTNSSFLRVNEAVIIAVGSSEFNEGKITIRNTTDQTILAVISPESSVTQQAVKTIPAGKTGIFYGGFISLSKKGLLAVIRERSGQTGVVFDRLRIEIEQDRFNDDLSSPIPFPEKSDVWINAFTSAGVTAASSVLNTIKVS